MNDKQKLVMKLQDDIITNYELWFFLDDQDVNMRKATMKKIKELKTELENLKREAIKKALMNS